MPRKPMPAEVWVARHDTIEFLAWDIDPLLPQGQKATRYVQAEPVSAALARDLLELLTNYLPPATARKAASKAQLLVDAALRHR